MTVSIYSLITAFIWFNLFVVLSLLFRRNLNIFLCYNLGPLVFLIALTLIRLFFPVETSFTRVLRSEEIMPFLRNLLQTNIVWEDHLVITLWLAFLIVSLAGAAVFFLRLIGQLIRTRAIVRTLEPWESPLAQQLMQRIMAETAKVRPYTILLSSAETSPKTIGYLHPTIVLPASIEVFSEEDIGHFLRHEWQHYLDKDLWLKLLVEFLCCFMWWNPLMYFFRANLNRTLELKCDVHVTRRMNASERTAYLTALYNALDSLPRRLDLSVSAGLLGSRKQRLAKQNDLDMRQRFELIRKVGKRNRKVSALFFTGLTILFLASFCVVLQPYYAPLMEDFYDPQDRFTENSSYTVHTPNTENAFIIDNKDGTYTLYIEGSSPIPLTEDDLKVAPNNTLPIIEIE